MIAAISRPARFGVKDRVKTFRVPSKSDRPPHHASVYSDPSSRLPLLLSGIESADRRPLKRQKTQRSEKGTDEKEPRRRQEHQQQHPGHGGEEEQHHR
jgi:hypothetical protein